MCVSLNYTHVAGTFSCWYEDASLTSHTLHRGRVWSHCNHQVVGTADQRSCRSSLSWSSNYVTVCLVDVNILSYCTVRKLCSSVTTWSLQCDQTFPVSAKSVACETIKIHAQPKIHICKLYPHSMGKTPPQPLGRTLQILWTFSLSCDLNLSSSPSPSRWNSFQRHWKSLPPALLDLDCSKAPSLLCTRNMNDKEEVKRTFWFTTHSSFSLVPRPLSLMRIRV